MLEKALINKYRYNFRGICNTEDLYDLDVEDLDSIYKVLNKELKEIKGESLLEKNQTDDILETKIEIIKHIVKIKLAEQKVNEDKALKKKRKQELFSIISEKQNEQYKQMTVEQLTQLVDEL